MKKWIHASQDEEIVTIADLDKKIRDYFGDQIVVRESGEIFNRGGFVYIIKLGDPEGKGNVYRIFCDDEKGDLIIQVCDYAAHSNKDDRDYFDDAQDYYFEEHDPNQLHEGDGRIETWFNLILDTIDEAEREAKVDPDYGTHWDEDWD